MSGPGNSSDIDKQSLYGEWLRNSRWRDALNKKLAHKSLDIPDPDEMHVDNSRRGLDWKGVAVIVAGALGAAAIAVSGLRQEHTPAAPPQPPVVTPAEEGQARIRVYWGDKEIVPGGSEETTVSE
jgi:hypothetical protein